MTGRRAAARVDEPIRPARPYAPGLRHALVFFSASVAGITLLLVDGALRAELWEHARIGVPYAILSASAVGLALAAAIAMLHGVERIVRSRWSLAASSALLVAAAAPLLLPIAAELAAGDGVARVLPTRWGTVLGALGLELAVLALWSWHRLLVRESLERSRHRKVFALFLGAIGLVGAVAAFSLARGGLEAYAFLLDVVALAFAVVAGTLIFAIFSRSRRLGRALVAAWILATGFAAIRILVDPGVLRDGREALVTTSQVAARLDRRLWPTPRGMTLRLDPTARIRCEPPSAAPPARPSVSGPRNVLLVSVDALRSDAVGWERGGRALMPNLSRFLRGSVHSPSAVTTYPATIFAVQSALSGLRPSRVLFAPSPPRTLLSRVAARVDVRSAHLPSISWFKTPAARMLLLGGLREHRYDNAATQVRAVVGELARARASGQSYAIWTHFYEPHEPYSGHAGFDFGGGARGRYSSEVAYLDSQLRVLFDYLERSGAYRDTLVVFFADHGEALGERGYFGHHVFLDGFITDVPLGVRAPGLAPRKIDGVVELTDVAATMADFFGVPQEVGSDGTSLFRGDPPPDRVAISEAFPIRGSELFALASQPVRTLEELDARMERIHTHGANRYSPKVALTTRDFRLIVDRETGLRALYRRGAPSSLQENVATREPRQLARLTARLERWHEETAEAIHCVVRGVGRRPRAMPASVTPRSGTPLAGPHGVLR